MTRKPERIIKNRQIGQDRHDRKNDRQTNRQMTDAPDDDDCCSSSE